MKKGITKDRRNIKRGLGIFLICFVISLLIGCATVPKAQQHFEKSRIFEASFDEIWTILTSSISEPGLTFGAQEETDSSFLILQKSLPGRRVKEVALAPSGMGWSQATATLKIIVNEEDEDYTQVIINTKITAIGRPGFFLLSFFSPPGYFSMGSTGVLEREYFDKISETLQKQE
ncbi:MAG: hypothetical protein ISS44_01965 [Candidatus Omnitrophica bacterium]|nr:hypothetical protein [Candidatus Omnitrophota bacterium]